MAYRLRAPLLAALVILLSGCSGPTAGANAALTTGPDPERSLTVFAAASLTGVFEHLAAAFTEQNPGNTVTTVYDGSSVLATQLSEGARADVFASADAATMAAVVAADVVTATPTAFATNTLEIAVAPGNPAGIRDLSDLADSALTVVTCAVPVPCGAASAELLRRAGVKISAASEEQNVKAVVTKVALGEADAGLVYATDVRAANDEVDGVTIPGAGAVANHYVIAPVAQAGNREGANAFVRFVLSDVGQGILADAGFGAP